MCTILYYLAFGYVYILVVSVSYNKMKHYNNKNSTEPK